MNSSSGQAATDKEKLAKEKKSTKAKIQFNS